MKPIIRCSELPRLLRCGGSRILAELVAQRDSATPHEGNMIHWMIAARAITELGAVPPPGGLPAPDVPAGYVLPKSSEWIVDYALRHLRETTPAGWSLEVEVPLAYEFSRFILSGHIDVLAVSPDGLKTRGSDWKAGYIPVEAADFNDQVLGYLVLKKRAYPSLDEAIFDVVQPRYDEEEGFERVSTVTLNDAELEAAVAQLEADVNAAIDRADEVESGQVQCRYCPVGIQCPAIQAEISDMKAKLSPQILARIKAEADDSLLGDIIIQARTVAGAIEQAEALLHDRLDHAQKVRAGCGVTITQKISGGKYKVLDPQAMWTAAQAILSPPRIARVVGWSTTRLRDEIAAELNIPKSGKAARTAESEFQARFMPHMEQGKRRQLIFT